MSYHSPDIPRLDCKMSVTGQLHMIFKRLFVIIDFFDTTRIIVFILLSVIIVTQVL